MRTVPRLLAAALVAALVAACASEPEAAATIDGVPISQASFDNSVDVRLGDPEELPAAEREQIVASAQAEVLGFFVLHEVYTITLREQGIEIPDEQYEEDRQAEIEGLGGEDEYEQTLNDLGYSIEMFELLVGLDTMNAALQRHVLVEEPAREVRHILVEDEGDAEQVLVELDEGGDFAELAAEWSTDPGSAQNGGAYPPAPRGQWVEEFDQAVWDADIGDLLGPIETSFGFHIIEVLDEVTLSADEMEPDQLAQMAGPDVSELINATYEQIEVEVDPSIGTWDPTLRQVVPADGGSDRVGVPDEAPPADPLVEDGLGDEPLLDE